MNRRTVRYLLTAALVVISVSGVHPQDCPRSPTGVNGKLFSCEQQHIYNRMVDDYRRKRTTEGAQRLGYILTAAERDGTAQSYYASFGRWAALAYQITGERRYAEKALAQWWDSGAPNIKIGDNLREYWIESAWMFDTLQPVIDAAERARWLAWHRERVDIAVGKTGSPGTRMRDSDQCLGVFLGLALWDQVADTHYLDGSFHDPERSDPVTGLLLEIPIGGLRATGANFGSMRNAVEKYLAMAQGGSWVEPGMYNKGTTQLLYMGVEWLRRATGDQTLLAAERTFRADHLLETFHELTPDLRDSFKYGDEQDPGRLQFPVRRQLFEILAGLTRDPRVVQLEADVIAANAGDTDFRADNWLYPRAFYFSDPYLGGIPWRTSIGNVHVSEGQGHVFWRTGWTPQDSGLHVYWPTFVSGYLDHFEGYGVGSIQLRRKGQWILTHPLAYGVDPRYHNHTLINGLGPSLEATDLIASAFKVNSFGYAAGISAGVNPPVYDGWWGPQPTYLHENGRSVFEFLDGPDDLLLVFERFHIDDPRALPSWPDAFPAWTRPPMEQRLGLIDTIWHTPVEPSVNGSALGFSVAGSNVRIVQLWPAPNWKIIDENQDSTLGGATFPGQKKFAAHSARNPTTSFSTQLTVISASESASATTVTPVDLGVVQGALVQRAGKNDVLVLFSAKPGPRLETSTIGDLVSFKDQRQKVEAVKHGRVLNERLPPITLVRATDVYIADLDSAYDWTGRVGGTVVPVTRLDGMSIFSSAPGGLLNVTVSAAKASTRPPAAPTRLKIGA